MSFPIPRDFYIPRLFRPSDLSAAEVRRDVEPASLAHYVNDSSSKDWCKAMRVMETEGEISPAQTDPSDHALDIFTPAFLRKQAA